MLLLVSPSSARLARLFNRFFCISRASRGFFVVNICTAPFGAIIMVMKKERLVIILILVISAFAAYYFSYMGDNGRANIWIGDEKEFTKPIDVIWRGEIISIMAGGSCVGLTGEFDTYTQAIACLPNPDSGELWELEGVVTVTGKWFGITCAYKNTIFGDCVPDVSIENIKSESN